MTRYLAYQPASVLQVTGDDAASYLQSQFSNDLRHPDIAQPATYGLWLDRKGRVRADSLILQTAPAQFLLVSRRCPAQSLLAIVEENIIADEVEVEAVTAEATALCLWGGETHSLAGHFGLSAGAFARQGNALLWLDPVPSPEPCLHVLCLGDPTAEAFFRKAHPAAIAAEAISPSEAEALRIQQGQPAVPVDIGPGDLPQEGGLERYAVSFNKGCYLGQEVMARLQAMGTPRRSLRRISLTTMPSNLPCPLFSGEREVGELRSATPAPGGSIGLALLKNSRVDENSAITLHPAPQNKA